MLVYRICKSKYQDDLSGNGAREYGGRWNSIGLPLVYSSSTSSLAMLEILCSVPVVLLNNDFKLITIEISDQIEFETISIDSLGMEWRSYIDYNRCRNIGDRWLKANKSLMLKVPSAVLPFEYNLLFNPLHRKSGLLKIKSVAPINFDSRIIANVLSAYK